MMRRTASEHFSSLELPAVAHARDWVRMGFWLVVATMVYNLGEGVVGLWAGMRADSIVLLGFGPDSFIECTAALLLFWRLAVEAWGANPGTIKASERKVHRFVGGTFLALALYVFVQASWTLWHREAPEASLMGMLLSIAQVYP